jgi:hypothetical protein
MLADALVEAEPSVIAQVAAQYRATVKELADLGEPKGTSVSDDLAAKRKARRAGAKSAAPPAGDSESRGGQGGG